MSLTQVLFSCLLVDQLRIEKFLVSNNILYNYAQLGITFPIKGFEKGLT